VAKLKRKTTYRGSDYYYKIDADIYLRLIHYYKGLAFVHVIVSFLIDC
jgi:hypothetical protein